MKEIFLLKHGEMILKGLNRARFEQRLIKNLKHKLAPLGGFEVYALQSAVYAVPPDGADIAAAESAIRTVFGSVAYCLAAECEKNIEAIKTLTAGYLRGELAAAKTFKVETKRADKGFPLTSPQISAAVGEAVLGAFPHLKVDVKNPEFLVNIEIRDRFAYIHGPSKKGAGGLPVGTAGRAVLLLSGGIDSPVAGYKMAKRGLEIINLHFFSYPYTGEDAKQKVLDLARIISPYTCARRVAVAPFTRIQEAIRDNVDEKYYTLITRRFMTRVAEKFALENGAGAIVTGESLGQVASQTLAALGVTQAVTDLPVLRPLIGDDKAEIVETARRIGTFETSILPFEDCCTVFTPRHPNTNPKIADIIEAEKPLDTDALVSDCVRHIEHIRLQREDFL